MLTYPELVELQRSLQSQRVLSVYVDRAVSDPAGRRAWRVELDHRLKGIRTSVASAPHAERAELERCLGVLDGQLPAGARDGPGWMAFIAGDSVQHVESLPVAMPTFAVWTTGAWISPYVRALKQARPVIAVIVDARKAAIHQYRDGMLDHVDTVRAHVTVEPPLHMGQTPRSGFHVGVRGSTGRDDAQRALTEGTARMLKDAASQVVRLAGSDGWIVVGGIPHVAEQAIELLSASAAGRVLHLPSLDVHATPAQIEAAVQEGASALRNASDLRHIAEGIEQEAGEGLSAVGPVAAQRELQQARVRELYFTHRYLEEHAAELEEAVRAALGQDASVEEVSGEAARALDEHGGVLARLRYRTAVAAAAEPDRPISKIGSS